MLSPLLTAIVDFPESEMKQILSSSKFLLLVENDQRGLRALWLSDMRLNNCDLGKKGGRGAKRRAMHCQCDHVPPVAAYDGQT